MAQFLEDISQLVGGKSNIHWALAFWNGQWFILKGIDTYSRYGLTFPATKAQPALLTGGLWNA